MGSDGTVGANKNSITIIGEDTPNCAQGYFVYDSERGSVTVSHLRFGPEPIHSTYLVSRASFVGCHQFDFLERMDVLAAADTRATFLLNAPFGPGEVWDHLPRRVQPEIIDKKMRLFVVDAYKVARDTGMGSRINTVMQTCFFALSGVLPQKEAITAIKYSIQDTYGKRGEASCGIISRSTRRSHISTRCAWQHRYVALSMLLAPVPARAPAFVRDVLGAMIAGNGD